MPEICADARSVDDGTVIRQIPSDRLSLLSVPERLRFLIDTLDLRRNQGGDYRLVVFFV